MQHILNIIFSESRDRQQCTIILSHHYMLFYVNINTAVLKVTMLEHLMPFTTQLHLRVQQPLRQLDLFHMKWDAADFLAASWSEMTSFCGYFSFVLPWPWTFSVVVDICIPTQTACSCWCWILSLPHLGHDGIELATGTKPLSIKKTWLLTSDGSTDLAGKKYPHVAIVTWRKNCDISIPRLCEIDWLRRLIEWNAALLADDERHYVSPPVTSCPTSCGPTHNQSLSI